jgi:hypothetical protein
MNLPLYSQNGNKKDPWPRSTQRSLDILLKHKIDPENDLSYYAIPHGSFKHEKVIYGVLFGKYDAGAAPLLDFERMVADDRIDRDDFVIIAEGEPIPYCNFGVTQKVDDAFAQEYQQLQQRDNNPLTKMEALGVLMNKLLRTCGL